MFFDRAGSRFYAAGVRGNLAKAFELANTQMFRRAPLPKPYTDFLGHKLFLFLLTVQGLGAFALITLGVILRNNNVAKNVIRPRIRQEIARAGVALLPMFFFVALALGFLVVGQTVSALARVGAISYLGSTMVIVVVRELYAVLELERIVVPGAFQLELVQRVLILVVAFDQNVRSDVGGIDEIRRIAGRAVSHRIEQILAAGDYDTEGSAIRAIPIADVCVQ